MRKIFAALAGSALFATPFAHAQLALTAEGIADGFTLSTFVSGYNFGSTYGPLSQGVLGNGNIISGSAGDGRIYVFHDTDGQTLGSAINSTSYSCQTGNCNYAMATAGGQVYGAQLFGGTLVHFNNDGSSTPIPGLQAAGTSEYLGMWGNPVNGHLIASTYQGLLDIDPLTGISRFVASVFPDGVSVSNDGQTAYLENGGAIQSYNLATGALIHTFNVGHSPDGTGVITGGIFNGDVIVNNNDGTLGLLNPTLADGAVGLYTIIASGGSRGDFTSPDTSNGTLFISQYERVDRLGCGPGCSIGSVTPVPEPETYALMMLGLAGLGAVSRRRKQG